MSSPQLDLKLSRAEALLLLMTLRIISDYQDVRLQKGVLGVIEQRLEALMDEAIDTSDIPEVRDWSKAERGKFYRGKKEVGE